MNLLTRRNWLVYSILAVFWLLLVGWQIQEHRQMRRVAREGFHRRAVDISNTLALIMRSQRFFVSRERIETVLKELVKQDEVSSIKLLNQQGDEVASAGDPIDLPKGDIPPGGSWDETTHTMTVMNMVDLGTNIIMSAEEYATNRPGRRPPEGDNPQGTNSAPAPRPESGFSPDGPRPPDSTNSPDRDRRFRFRPRYSEEEIKQLIKYKSPHGFVMVMPAHIPEFVSRHDFWLRLLIVFLGTAAAVGSAIAWRNLAQNSELQIRLVRASELNSHLKDMNLAAAGLAHETRNPLNIVRGLAQMIFKQEDASPEIRIKSREIIEETDRVAAQLNEFINYSRPREVRRAPLRLQSLLTDVSRALNYDVDEKKVKLLNEAEDITIQADEQLLRQALFNLVLNAIQAVPAGGEIKLRAGIDHGSECFLEITDNGPGVAVENREQIFKPYFTTHQEGTGLGLAVVQQIVMAHGWEIKCLPVSPSGACFRVTHIKLSS